MRSYHQENRLTNDNCAQLTRELQNSSVNDRQLYNYFYTHDCKCEVFDDFLFDNNMVVKDGYGFTTGCTVDTDSDLRLKGVWTNEREKNQLNARWNQGVPNVGKGGLIPNIESRIRNGDDTSDIRNCDKIVEHDFDRFTPLVGCMAKSVQNPDNIVEPWTRGGQHTRNEVRSNEYLQRCGFNKDGKLWTRANP